MPKHWLFITHVTCRGNSGRVNAEQDDPDGSSQGSVEIKSCMKIRGM